MKNPWLGVGTAFHIGVMLQFQRNGLLPEKKVINTLSGNEF
jgi:hypothetical protein